MPWLRAMTYRSHWGHTRTPCSNVSSFPAMVRGSLKICLFFFSVGFKMLHQACMRPQYLSAGLLTYQTIMYAILLPRCGTLAKPYIYCCLHLLLKILKKQQQKNNKTTTTTKNKTFLSQYRNHLTICNIFPYFTHIIM